MLRAFEPNRCSFSGQREEATITIVYDDIRAGQRAGRLFCLVGHDQGDELKIALQPWRFDLLTDPDWGQFATAEAMQSDILVIAISDFANLSTAIERWFTTWLNRKRGFHAAVVALVERRDRPSHTDSMGIDFLERATREAGLDFFTPRQDYPDLAPEIIPVPPYAFSCGSPYRHSGLNE